MAYYIGIDGGGTRTTAVLGDERSVLAEVAAGGSNITRLGEEKTREVLHQVIHEVCAKAKVSPAEVQRVVAGLAGAPRERARNALLKILSEAVHADIYLTDDIEISHQAVFDGAPGIIVESGTGSFAYGRNEHGETMRAGGWGFAVSDEGSGHWIGREAVASALRTHDRGGDATLMNAVLRAWNLKSMDDLVTSANGTPPPEFAALFPAVASLADAGDQAARDALTRAGEELARLGITVAHRLFAARQPLHFAAGGGVFRNSSLVYEAFRTQVTASWPEAVVERFNTPPVLGALALARRGAATR